MKYSLHIMRLRVPGYILRTVMISSDTIPLTRAQAYDAIWGTFREIQKSAFSAIVFYGQETGSKSGKFYDELGVLLPIR